MIILQLKNGKEITCASKDELFFTCRCEGIACDDCPFGTRCSNDFGTTMTFGEAMEQRKEQLDEMVEYIENIDNSVEEQEASKKKYTFEFTDEQAMYLHAFMNVFNHDAVQETLNTTEFMSKDEPPFVLRDLNNIPKEWDFEDTRHIANVLYDVSNEIYNKLCLQRGFDE